MIECDDTHPEKTKEGKLREQLQIKSEFEHLMLVFI